MNYEQKYKELAGKIKKAYLYAQTDSTIAVLEDILPELAESEDERIRKALLNEFIHLQSKGYKFAGLEGDKIIAWLEKQESVGEIVERCKTSWYNEGKIQGQIEGLSDDEKYQQGWHDALEKQGFCSPFNYEHANIQQKDFAPKIVPKFKAGDWIIIKGNENVKQIVRIDFFKNGQPQYILSNGLWFGNGTEVRLWTIEDAQEGDVLYSPCCKLIWLYKDEKTCYLGNNLNYHSDSIVVNNPICMPTDARPATKDEQTTFFAKIKELGYEWDAEKKELKKTETKGGEG